MIEEIEELTFHAERHARFRRIVPALRATQISADGDAGSGVPEGDAGHAGPGGHADRAEGAA